MKIGLLPLYVKLYDDKLPDLRIRLEAFYAKIAGLFRENGIDVAESPFCRLAPEFSKTVADFEAADVDAIVTLHMAYSPSLECIDALCATTLPLIVLDTTETLVFPNTQDAGEIMYNHGVHGVMDMCSMLTRRGRPYAIAAGHYLDSDVIARVCGLVRAAASANRLKHTKVGLVGGVFDGMGDFQVDWTKLKNRFGIDVTALDAESMKRYAESVTDDEIAAEKADNAARYELGESMIEDEYTDSVRSCLAMRKCIGDRGLTAFSVNFSNMGAAAGINSMPFLEACKALEKGIGYAGEGDVMTAAFVGALLTGYPETTFVEIFCPDWKNDTVFLSHMGEVNYRDAAIRPRIERVGTNYSPGRFPYVGYTRMKGGRGVYVNVCCTKDDFKLVMTAGTMQDYDSDAFDGSMRGWMKTDCPTAHFLENLSRYGATHHSAFVYGASVREIEYFGQLLGLETVII